MSAKTVDEILTSHLLFPYLYNSFFSFKFFYMKERECEKLEVLILKPHEDWKYLHSSANVLYKTPKLR